MCFDSSSSSSASTSTATTNTDARVVGGEKSTNISAANSTISVAVSDSGAIQQAFGFAGEVTDNAFDAVEKSSAQLANAYSEAKAGEQKILVGVGVAIVAIVAVQSFKGR